jgi:hypothetical protein
MSKSKYVFSKANRKNLDLDMDTSHGGWPQGEYDPKVKDLIYNWYRNMKLAELKNRIKEIINEEINHETHYRSHDFEPSIGEIVVNINPKCKHKGSIGIVIKIQSLENDAGKIAKYCCLNSGKHWNKGQILSKSFDQISPYEEQESLF